MKESYSALSHAQVNELFTKWTHIYIYLYTCLHVAFIWLTLLLVSKCSECLHKMLASLCKTSFVCFSVVYFRLCETVNMKLKPFQTGNDKLSRAQAKCTDSIDLICAVQFDECNATDVINVAIAQYLGRLIDWRSRIAIGFLIGFSTCAQFYVSQYGLDATMMIVGKTCT